MIKLEVIEPFTLGDYGKLKNIKRKNQEKEGYLFVGDTFECDEKMAKYLTGENDKKKVVTKIIEVIPEEKVIPLDDESIKVIAKEVNKAIKKPSKKKTSKK